ncbi:MAG: diphthine synthase [Candidatus Woesearchaeota archaeon]
MLNIIGIGLCDEKDITIRGFEIVKNADIVYLENYTSVLNVPVEKLEKFYNKKIITADRELIEKKSEETIIKDAETKNVVLLVGGDALSATTHIELVKIAKEKNISVRVIHNASIFTAVTETGLQLYKFGKTTSIPFPEKNYQPETAYDIIKENQRNKSHTLILLDLRPDEKKFMSANEAIEILLDIEHKRKEKIFTEKRKIIVCARLGSNDSIIKYGSVEKLKNINLGKPPHCLVVPSKTLHFLEEEFLKFYEI